jgi:hypothetical protein
MIEHMLGCFSPRFSALFLPIILLLLIPSGSFPADLTTVAAQAHERTVLAESFSGEKLWYWQKRLNLQDWKVSLLVVRTTDLKPKTLGNIHWDLDKKTAVIRVLDPADYTLPFHEMLDDMEFTVVHELIHLQLAPVLNQVSRNEASRRDEEHAVNHMAEALLKLQRGQ